MPEVRMNPNRITIAVDDQTIDILKYMIQETNASQSELIRRAIRFYHEYSNLLKDKEKIENQIEMMSSNEHIILDVDHWILFLKFIEDHPNKEEFWNKHEKIALSHAEQLSYKIKTAKDLLKRLESCGFFKLVENSNKEFTLVLFSELSKKFIKTFIEIFLSYIGLKIEIKEDIEKLRVKIK
ncbi:MAG: CopG family transcriptional regulator [Candidatus Methanoliparum thermophilum]|uniref:CopG family transcriptional regulator n=1 Tax=Methanoliparum thermophilum TaxID=2491083 RepID=A0A520KSA7_METT2|nr:ribbon-helix-helix protein, CopG family [Candidatus Methanoliparum sp. LAM-1]RZN64637.1 MAG: CopG family transcriptional regulator [Candidatus Methanoliparum thermophilum]BDC35737.1 CopG family transcriptional regulator [Candidatus Methanoliparum sp. LAM-1]